MLNENAYFQSMVDVAYYNVKVDFLDATMQCNATMLNEEASLQSKDLKPKP